MHDENHRLYTLEKPLERERNYNGASTSIIKNQAQVVFSRRIPRHSHDENSEHVSLKAIKRKFKKIKCNHSERSKNIRKFSLALRAAWGIGIVLFSIIPSGFRSPSGVSGDEHSKGHS